MAQHSVLLFTKAVEGREQEYEDFLERGHGAGMIKVAGVKRLQRFRLGKPAADAGVPAWTHLTLYTFETDDFPGLMARIGEMEKSGEIPSDTTAVELSSVFALPAVQLADLAGAA